MGSPPPPDPHGRLATRLLALGLTGFEAWANALPPALRAPALARHAGWQAEAGGVEAHFLGPRGTPAFVLLTWVLEGCGLSEADPRAALAAEGMIAAYLAARIQDDLVDEGAPPRLGYLHHLLAARVERLLVQVAGDGEFLALHEALVRDFCEAAWQDAALRASRDEPWEEEHLALQGRKYLPMVGPLAALLVGAGQAALVAPLRAAVEELAVGLQITNDLLGAGHDLATDQRSPVLAALGLVPGQHLAVELLPAVRRALGSGALVALVERAHRALVRAEVLSELLPGGSLLAHLRARRAALTEVHERLGLQAVLLPRPLVLDLELTQRCSLGCPACFVRQQLAGAPPAVLETELALAIVEEAAGYDTVLHLTGGEPFEHSGIWAVLERAAERGFAGAVVNTNGLRVGPAELVRLAALRLPVRLLVSLDGPPGLHARTRGHEAQRAAQAVLAHPAAPGLEVVCASLLTRELLAFGLDAWLAWLDREVRLGLPLVLWPLHAPGAVPRTQGSPLAAPDWAEAARQVTAALAAGRTVTVADDPVINPLLRALGVPDERLWRCEAGGVRLCVRADGAVTPCHPLPLILTAIPPVGGFVGRARHHPAARRQATGDLDGCRTCPEAAVCRACGAVQVAAGRELGCNDLRCRAIISPDASSPCVPPVPMLGKEPP
jgi:MoaA/NifB/PqqE/SkfB family radical SAM enzyme